MPSSISNSIFNSSHPHNINALRGLVMLFVLLGHVRETFFPHRQVGNSMGVVNTELTLSLSRILVHLRAPIFAFLTSLSALLCGKKYQGCWTVSALLFKHGLFLVALELALVNFVWIFQLLPTMIYLQVV